MANTSVKPPKGAGVAKPDSGNKGFLLAIIAIVVIGAAVVAFLAANRDSKVGDQTGAVEVTGEALPAFTESGVSTSSDEGIGLVGPTIAGTTFSGDPLTIGPDGSPKVVYFVAHWCPHCQAEIPKVQQLIDSNQVPEGLEVYAVSTAVDATRGNYPPESWLDIENFTPLTLKDDEGSPALQAYGGASFPYVVYLDGENRVLARSSGEIPDAQILQLWEMTANNQALGGQSDGAATDDQ